MCHTTESSTALSRNWGRHSCHSVAVAVRTAMFRKRRSLQKPADSLLVNFRQQFPELSTVTSTPQRQPAVAPVSRVDKSHVDAPVPADEKANLAPGQAFQPDEPTAQPTNEPWRLTTSITDSNSFNFSSLANPPPDYYISNPGSTSTPLHPQSS